MMRQHRLALCDEHYLEWFVEQTERTIRMFRMFDRSERVLVAVSGGKDSLSLWDVLLRLGYQADGLYIGLGIDGGIRYSDQSYEGCQRFVEERWPEARLIAVDVQEIYGETIPEVAARTARGREKPCAVCGLIKRYVMNRVAYEGGYAALATGHNLDDEVAVLFGNVMNWQVGYMARQGPVLSASQSGFVRKVKPLCRFYERETAAYALLRGIDYVYDECPYADGSTSIAYKEWLARLEEGYPGIKLRFYLGFLKAKERGLIVFQADEAELHVCEKCGQPTSAPGICAFCRLWEYRQPARAIPNLVQISGS
ncbi:MAG: TIGR00269 family protein [Thermoflexus sp.]|nr:TIGR00269 family protein [Thermoflexus sp.]